MIPSYTVVIRAMDANTFNPIAGASVTFNGISKNTNSEGSAEFTHVAPSANVYTFSVVGTGTFSSASGEIELPLSSPENYLMENNVVRVIKELSSPGIYFSLTTGMMTYYGAATVTVDGVDYVYDSGMGSVVVNCAIGTHTYKITPADVTKAILKGTVTVSSNTLEYVGLSVVAGRKIEIYVTTLNSTEIQGAKVTLNGVEVTTDISGMALFERYPAGIYTYSISMEGYISVAATELNVNNEDILKVIKLTQPTYSITIVVKEGSTALAGQQLHSTVLRQ